MTSDASSSESVLSESSLEALGIADLTGVTAWACGCAGAKGSTGVVLTAAAVTGGWAGAIGKRAGFSSPGFPSTAVAGGRALALKGESKPGSEKPASAGSTKAQIQIVKGSAHPDLGLLEDSL